jgi:hypothetical protein
VKRVKDQASGHTSFFGAQRRSGTSDDLVTVIAAGMLAATLAAFCHETLGHGLGCVADGGRIILLTSIWFQCRGAGSVTDAGGPIGSLIVGVAAVAFLSCRIPDRIARLVLVLFGAFSLFWFAAQLISHPIFNRDDWAFVARRMGWSWVWRPIMASIGVAVYAAAMWMVHAVLRRAGAPTWRTIRLAYAAGVTSAVIAGLMWSTAPIRSAREEFLTLGIAPLGLLVVAARSRRNAAGSTDSAANPDCSISRSWIWIAISVVVFGGFLLVQARGLGSLAQIGLPH